MVEEIAKNPELLDLVSRNLETIFYTGGDVSHEVGDVLMNKVKMFNVNGSTEMGVYPTLQVEGSWSPEDWKFISPHPAAGLEFRHQSNNEYEAFVVRNSDPELVQPIFILHPELHEYPVGDLFSPHPSKPGLWEYRGRADDMIVLVSGGKTNPIAMEQHVASHPEVRDVLMTGTRRHNTGLLIEPITHDRLGRPRKKPTSSTGSGPSCRKPISSIRLIPASPNPASFSRIPRSQCVARGRARSNGGRPWRRTRRRWMRCTLLPMHRPFLKR